MTAITSHSNAQDKANLLNLIHQAIISMKEGIPKAITTKVGSDITGMVLKTADSTDFQSIDDYQIKDVLSAVLQDTKQPNTDNILSQILTII